VVLIWLFLLGWAPVVTGHFSPVEITMTGIISLASIVGLVVRFCWLAGTGRLRASATAALFALLQLAAFRISLLPYIASR
jgi:alpha-D-ribose 1-methylphosphonate 5-triphosphate synthase subunit PhnG